MALDPSSQTYGDVHFITMHRCAELEEQFSATLDPVQRSMWLAADSASGLHWIAEWELKLRAIAHHFPGLEAAILAIADHVQEPEDVELCQICEAAKAMRVEPWQRLN